MQVSDRVAALAGASMKSAGATYGAGELTLAKAQIVENMRAALTYQSALLAPEMLNQLVNHFPSNQAASGRSAFGP